MLAPCAALVLCVTALAFASDPAPADDAPPATVPAAAEPTPPAEAAPATAAAPAPLDEAAYREAAGRWNELWRERPPLGRRVEALCVSAWQEGDHVRGMVSAVTPPPKFAAYHTALLACIEASLAVSDECLLKPLGGPKWMPYFLSARKKCAAVARVVNTNRLRLPRAW
jgi:hypothetical protein